MTELLPDTVRAVEDPLVRVLVEHIDNLSRDLQIECDRADRWKQRADEAERRVAELETDRFASA